MSNDAEHAISPPPDASNGQNEIPDRWLILLVHGVGEQIPGQMTDAVSAAIHSVHPSRTADEEYVVLKVDEPGSSQGSYPIVTKRLRTPEGHEAVLAEVFWADVSRLGGGTYDLLVGIFRLLFGLRYISDQAAAQSGPLAFILRWLLYGTILLARGPFLALLLLGTIYCLPLSTRWAGRITDVPDHWLKWLTGPACYLCLGLAASILVVLDVIRRGRRLRHASFTISTIACATAVTALCLSEQFRGYINWLYDNELTAGGSPAYYLATTIWLTDWVRDATTTCLGLAAIPTAAAWLAAPREWKAGLEISYEAAILQVLLWFVVLAPLSVVLDFGLAAVAPSIGREFAQGGIFNWAERLLFLYAILLSALVVWAFRSRWARKNPSATWPHAGPPPRLIVGLPTRTMLITLASILAWLGVGMAFEEILPAWQFFRQSLEAVDRVLGLIAAPLWLLTVAALIFLITHESVARVVLHVVTDIVNHFFRPEEDYPVRRQIEARFRNVFNRLNERVRPTHITVIAHSQGTVITFNALAQLCAAGELSKAEAPEIDVVTVGSPITHLYQHYFPAQFPPQNDPTWAVLRKTIKTWLNVFRTDDYIGTYISSGAADYSNQSFPQNIPAKPGGHTHYWQNDIFETLADRVP